jgi:hypothetical protein
MPQIVSKVSVEKLLAMEVKCSILTAGTVHREFRLKDVMFYLDLLTDVMSPRDCGRSIDIQYVQVQRWLRRYEQQGWIHLRRLGKLTLFCLKSEGIKGLLHSLVAVDQLLQVPEALLVQQMLDAYGPLLREHLYRLNGDLTDQKPESLSSLFLPGIVLKSQVKLLDQIITKQERRTLKSTELYTHCIRELEKGEDTRSILGALPSEFSYQLSHQKPFRHLLQEIPERLSDFEVREGFALRHRRFYEPYLAFLKMQRSFYLQVINEKSI